MGTGQKVGAENGVRPPRLRRFPPSDGAAELLKLAGGNLRSLGSPGHSSDLFDNV